MYALIAKRFTFDAAHRLDQLPPDHKCYRMHGHTYAVELTFNGLVQSNGFVIDYADIDRIWQPIFDMIDHRVLNDVPGLEIPSTEYLANWIWDRVIVDPKVQDLRVRVRVYESSTTYCEVPA